MIVEPRFPGDVTIFIRDRGSFLTRHPLLFVDGALIHAWYSLG